MSDTWQQPPPPQDDRLPFQEPYPGFAHTHQEYYEQYRRQQELQANVSAPPNPGLGLPIRYFFDPNMFPEPMPGLNPQQRAVYDSYKEVKRQKLMRMYTFLAIMCILFIVPAIIRLFT